MQQSGNYAKTIVNDLMLEDYRSNHVLLDVLINSPMSQDVLRRQIASGSHQVSIPILAQHALGPAGFQTESAFQTQTYSNPDLSAQYAQSVVEQAVIDFNRIAIGTHYLPSINKLVMPGAGLLQDAEIRANIAEIGDQMEKAALAQMIVNSRVASWSGNTATEFALDFSSATALMSDFALIAGDCNKLNIPMDQRYMVLNSTVEPLFAQHATSASRDYVSGLTAETGRLPYFMGFKLIYSNNIAAADAVVFTPECFALCSPSGIVVEELKDINRLGEYTRLWTLFGVGALGKEVTSAAGTEPSSNANLEKAGLWSLVVSA